MCSLVMVSIPGGGGGGGRLLATVPPGVGGNRFPGGGGGGGHGGGEGTQYAIVYALPSNATSVSWPFPLVYFCCTPGTVVLKDQIISKRGC